MFLENMQNLEVKFIFGRYGKSYGMCFRKRTWGFFNQGRIRDNETWNNFWVHAY